MMKYAKEPGVSTLTIFVNLYVQISGIFKAVDQVDNDRQHNAQQYAGGNREIKLKAGLINHYVSRELSEIRDLTSVLKKYSEYDQDQTQQY
jgi:hypothetical protein